MKRLRHLFGIVSAACVFVLTAGMGSLAGAGGEIKTDVPGEKAFVTDCANLIPGEDYFFAVVKNKDAEALMAQDNVLYVDQGQADESGRVSFSWILWEGQPCYIQLYGSDTREMKKWTWSLSEDGVLTIYGGEVIDFGSSDHAPWYGERAGIRKIIVKSGVSRIGSCAFDGCSNVEEICFEGAAPDFAEDTFSSLQATAVYPENNDTWTEELKKGYGGQIKWKGVNGFRIEGTVKSFGDVSAGITIELRGADGAVAAEKSVTGNCAEYRFENVKEGSYTLTISKKKHITRSYGIVVSDKSAIQDVKLWLKGDVNGDGNITAADLTLLARHVCGLTEISDPGLWLAAELDGDQIITAKDLTMLARIVAGLTEPD